ncbi:hypothetical protein Tco_0366709 [Tanacetum coccineum]
MYQDAMKERQTLSCVDNNSKSNDDMARNYTHSNTVQHAECFKQKMLLVQLQEVGIQLRKDQLAILANIGDIINFGPVSWTNISVMASDALVEVHNPDNVDNNMINQAVQAMPSSEYFAVGKNKLYVGNVIKNTSAIVIPDSEETLMLAEESRSKMLLKQQDPMVLEKKVITTPVDYAVLNQLSQDFEK